MDAAVDAILSELDGIMALKDEPRTTLKGFLGGKYVFSLLQTGSGWSFVRRCNILGLPMGR